MRPAGIRRALLRPDRRRTGTSYSPRPWAALPGTPSRCWQPCRGTRPTRSGHLFLPRSTVALPASADALTQLLPSGLGVAIEETNHLGSAQTSLQLRGGSGDRPHVTSGGRSGGRNTRLRPRPVESHPAVRVMPAVPRSLRPTTQGAGQHRDGQSPGWQGSTWSVKLLLPSATRGTRGGEAVRRCEVTTRGVDLRSACGADSKRRCRRGTRGEDHGPASQ